MKKKKATIKVLNRNVTPNLPQNIVSVGERVFEDKNIYIHQKVYEQIHKFSANKTENEHGGILIGRVLNEMGKENTIIEGFIEAKYNTATPTTLTFTHQTWEYFHTEIDRKFKDKKIVGWIHTHPNFGIFLSENDRFIQQNFFTDSNQVAYVVDPIQNDEGFFFWINDKLERCPGFYLFDKNGVKIKQKLWNKDDISDVETKPINKSNFWIIILIIALAANLFTTIYQNKRIRKLEKQIEDQNIIIQYGMYGVVGAPDVSVIADDIRMQIEMQKKSKQKVAEETRKQQKEQASSEDNAVGQKKSNPENSNQIPKTPQNDNENKLSKETENNGGNK